MTKSVKQLASSAKEASKHIVSLSASKRKDVLEQMAKKLWDNRDSIVEANKKDLDYAQEVGLNSSMKDRLTLDEDRIKGMVDGVLAIAEQKEVVNTFYNEFVNEAGLTIKRQRIPLGVILMIFESRPNVVVDCAALAIKSSNAIVLKGGKEAKYSNEILGQLIQDVIADFIPRETVQVLASDDRSVVNELLSMEEFIDVVIPRGGHRLIEYVSEHAKMPVIAHFKGICHMYIDEKADAAKAIDLVVNAKTHRTGVCNAIETLLVHRSLKDSLLPKIVNALLDKGTEIRLDSSISLENTKAATEEDWSTEYLDNILSIKLVDDVDGAISHIGKFGSNHSECVVSADEEVCNKFLSAVDASCVMVNASTRFNDGGQLGLGAELGISTTKIHAYGPMGAEQMTTSRYVVIGDGHIRK